MPELCATRSRDAADAFPNEHEQSPNRFRSILQQTQNETGSPGENRRTNHKRKKTAMKLHNLLLTAALFLSAGAVFATKPSDKQDLEATTPSTTSVSTVKISDFTWTASEYVETVNVNLKKDGQGGYIYAVYDASLYDTLKADPLFSNLNPKKNREAAEAKYAGKLWFLDEGDNEITLNGVRTLGVISNSPHTAFSSNNPETGFLFYQQGTLVNNTVYFAGNKVSYGKDPNKNGGGTHAADITFGAPLPAPIATLLIALGFGAAFVMYRNRKQAKA